MSKNTVRILAAVVIGYGAYVTMGWMLGVRPDSVIDWMLSAAKGFLFVGVAVYVVILAGKRKQRAREVSESDRATP
ncbi:MULTISPECIES: hypothetical protein [Nocardia]|uniref:Uncharacterized protein n=1 Tax=Nocardia aurea TaxID=2144174 RepID=A0ABV3G5P5_9NOCA|nr:MULTISPECIES: hypothetical protein [Nocardia]